MEILSLLTNEINQNGYNFNLLTKNKIGFLYIAPVNVVPDDCLACDGYVLKISDYRKLHAVIGTTFNTGSEASDEFRIPDYNITKRFLQPGANVGTQIAAGLPNITGIIGTGNWGLSTGQTLSGAFYSGGGKTYGVYGQSVGHQCNFAASNSNPLYGASSTVQPPSQIVHICIRYK